VSQVVGDRTDDDIRHCGCPIDSKRRQERRSRDFFMVFARFLGVPVRRLICFRGVFCMVLFTYYCQSS